MEQMIRSVYSLNSLTPLILLTHSASLCFSSGSWLWLLYGHICRLWLQLHVWRRCHLQWVKLPTHGHCCKRGSNTSNSSHASSISLITLRTNIYGPMRHELEYEEFDPRHLWAVWAVTLLCINVGAVSQTSSWCSLSDQAQQSLYVHVTFSVSSQQRWCCWMKLFLYVHVICSKLVLSDKPVSVCTSYFLCPHKTLVLSW